MIIEYVKSMTNEPNKIFVNGAHFQKDIMKSTKPVLVVFFARWCGSCHIIAPLIENLADTYKEQIYISMLDVDENKELVSEYGIVELPFLLFFNNGKIVDHIIGAVSKEVLECKFKALLQFPGNLKIKE